MKRNPENSGRSRPLVWTAFGLAGLFCLVSTYQPEQDPSTPPTITQEDPELAKKQGALCFALINLREAEGPYGTSAISRMGDDAAVNVVPEELNDATELLGFAIDLHDRDRDAAVTRQAAAAKEAAEEAVNPVLEEYDVLPKDLSENSEEYNKAADASRTALNGARQAANEAFGTAGCNPAWIQPYN